MPREILYTYRPRFAVDLVEQTTGDMKCAVSLAKLEQLAYERQVPPEARCGVDLAGILIGRALLPATRLLHEARQATLVLDMLTGVSRVELEIDEKQIQPGDRVLRRTGNIVVVERGES